MISLASVMATMVTMVGVGTSVAASPDAWSVGGQQSAFVVGCQGLGQMEDDLVKQVPGLLSALGLEDPDLEDLIRQALKHMGLKGKRSFARAFGLRPDGAVAIHVLEKQGKPLDWVLAVDVVNGQTFTGNLTRAVKALAEKAQRAAIDSKKEAQAIIRERAERDAAETARVYKAEHGDAPLKCMDHAHDNGLMSCVPKGHCATDFHDGGKGECVPVATCSRRFHLWAVDGNCNKKKEPKAEPPVRVGRQQRLPGGGREVEICHTESNRCYRVRIQGRLAFVSPMVEALDAMQPGAIDPQPLSDRFRDGDQPGVGCMLRLRRRQPDESPVPWTAFVEELELVFRSASDGAHTVLDLHLGRAAAGVASILRPSATGAAARRVMEELSRGSLSAWWRLGLDVEAAWGQMQALIPPERLTRIQTDLKRESGLDLERDIVGVLTGDLMVACDGGLMDCVLLVGVRGSKGARGSIEKLQKTLVKNQRMGDLEIRLPNGRVSLKVLDRSGGVTHYQSTFKSGEKGKDPDWEFTWHWALDENLLYLSLFPGPIHGLVDPTRRGALQPRPPLLQSQGFGADDLMASYAEMGDPGAVIRQILAALRSWLPPGWWPGRLTRLVDMGMALSDQLVAQASVLTRDGDRLHGESHVQTLPIEGQPGFDADLHARWTAAMRTRYAGRVRASNRALAKLAVEYPGTPWGRRAEANSLATGDMLSSILPLWMGMLGQEGQGLLQGMEEYMKKWKALSRFLGGASR